MPRWDHILHRTAAHLKPGFRPVLQSLQPCPVITEALVMGRGSPALPAQQTLSVKSWCAP